MNSTPISVKEKISYGLGDTGCNLVWQTVMLFMAYFYTDIFGLSPAHMGTMFLAVRVLDAVTDVLMGAVADRTKSKYGQFRPYLLWFAIPFGVLCCLTFYTPDLSYSGKLIYAYVSYTLLSLVYTAINVPYCAMINNISNDSRERVSLQSWRFALSTLGGLIVSLTALPLVAYLGKGNLQNGYFYTMMVMGTLSIILFFICFSLTKERFTTDVELTKQNSILDDLKTLLSNRDWRILFILNVVNLVAVLFKGGTTLYFVNSIMNRPELGSLLLTATLASGVFGAMISSSVFKNIDKVKGFKVSMLLEAALLLGMYFVPGSNVVAIFTLVIVINIVQLAATPLQWSMLSDIIDAEEQKSGKKLSGIVFSTNLFAIKLGIAIGGALVGYFLAIGNYVGGASTQPESALEIIRLLFTIFPAILVALLVVIMRNYSLNDKTLSTISHKKSAA